MFLRQLAKAGVVMWPTRPLVALSLAAAGAMIGLSLASASAKAAAAVHYGHIFVIVEENHGYTDVIGNPAAPNLNALASGYGVAANYFAVSHPSEPNYVALLGGSPFTVNSDDPYYVNRVAAPSLISQLDHSHISWKAYLQALPHPGYQGICYPANCNGEPDKDPLYVSKHNAIGNFSTSFSDIDGVTLADGTVWLVGSARDAASGNQLTVVARNSGAGWTQVAAPNPGNGDRILGGISAAGGAAWAAGAFDTDAGRAPLIEMHG